MPRFDVGEFDPGAIQDWYENALVTPAMKTWEKDIVPVGDKINGLQPIQFEYTEEAKREHPEMTVEGRTTGFLAEDVAEKYPEAVIYDAIGRPDAVNYGLLFCMMEIG